MGNKNLPAANVPARIAVQSDISGAALQRWNPDVMAAAPADGAAEISILDPIGADPWGDGLQVSAKRIGAALRAIGGADVVVNINSPGGDFFEGLAIYNLLREYGGRVTVRVLGVAASAASIIAMAGDKVLIGRGAFLMIHNTWVGAAGDRHALRDVADWLEPFDAAAAGIYAARCDLDQAKIAAMLDRETWLSGQAAVDQGFADGLLPADELAQAPARAAGELSPLAAQKKIDALMAGKASKAERRALVAVLKNGGTSGAAPAGMSSAALAASAEAALAILKSL